MSESFEVGRRPRIRFGPGSRTALPVQLEDWAHRLEMPRLGRFGVGEAHVPRIVEAGRGCSTTTNPIALTDAEIAGILRSRR
jgi:alcohol dehydrogenase